MSTANVAKTKKDTYEKWIASGDITCCYMLVLMSNMLRQKCQGMRTTVDIMASLKYALRDI